MFNLKGMYSFLLSHTFPGLLLTFELQLSLQWFATLDVWQFIHDLWTKSTSNAIIIIVVLYVVSTILGIIVDAIHHFAFEDFMSREETGQKFTAFLDTHSVDVYKHFLEDGIWYQYEAYANIFVALVPGLFLFYYWLLFILHVGGWRFALCMVIYGGVLFIMCFEALYTYRQFEKDAKEFIKVFSVKPEKETSDTC